MPPPPKPSSTRDPALIATAARVEDDIVFEGSAEDAIRFLEGEHADDIVAELKSEGLLGCDSSD